VELLNVKLVVHIVTFGL